MGLFIGVIDFMGYVGRVRLVCRKELVKMELEWFGLLKDIGGFVGGSCWIVFIVGRMVIEGKYMEGLKVKNRDFYIKGEYNRI